MASWQAKLYSLFLRAYLKRRPLGDETAFVQFARRKFDPPQFMRQPVPPYAQIDAVSENGVVGEWVRAQDRPAQRTIYYLHGGGYVVGSPQLYRPFTATLAKAAQAKVFALDYRLAPEHRFPAAVDDAVAGYRWLLAQGARPENMLIGGDSAGGGLTLAALVRLRAEGLPLPAAAVLLSPWTDLAGTGKSLLANEATDAMFYADALKTFAPIYLGKASALEAWASPLYADLKGLPPLLIFVSKSECLLDDSLRLAAKARAAGVSVDLQAWEDLSHVWPVAVGFLPEARAALSLIADFAQRQLAGSIHSLTN
ncbi:MAG: alpha/beta hydrolase [Acidobacteria bacterium]|nr:alpha/beta hydrolase [Acidobacteriota bacterium]MBI3426758.1 alpha/beta hydrolase [Acidobacteriota bacterium]